MTDVYENKKERKMVVNGRESAVNRVLDGGTYLS
jgi:hypothetical protein